MLEVRERANYPITISVDDLGMGFCLAAQADLAIGSQRLLGYLTIAVKSLVEALEHAPDTLAASLQVLPERERKQAVEEFNETKQNRPDQLIQELFEGQVRLNPQAIAVSCEGELLTYAELNMRANQIAWHLRDRGVGAEHLVGLCMDRSVEMVVGLLGILKAGGAYLPLDPSYPPERLAYMLGDATPTVVLSQEWLKRQLPQSAADVVTIDTDWEAIVRRPTRDPALRPQGLNADSMASTASRSSGRATRSNSAMGGNMLGMMRNALFQCTRRTAIGRSADGVSDTTPKPAGVSASRKVTASLAIEVCPYEKKARDARQHQVDRTPSRE